ncbi:phosphotransferase-like protein [Lederbergia citrea]|uniref:phosphotransferase-like protein n=1 Tax=Lederbergia citrea TaxID=2833581 RepID=UPI001BCA3376|nr:AAA family ATPase [Lederbergia citrea]MBS4176862.1 AAA family ATPase [Lederbergia citrea]
MNNGKIIFLNGVTSSGKTSIVDAIQLKSEDFFYVLAIDLFEQMIGDKYLRENYWKYISETNIMMYYTAKLFSDHGKNVLIDGIMLERPEIEPHYEKVNDIFAGYPLHIVEVFCPLEICRQRNIERGDRTEDLSDWQSKIMAKDIPYNYTVNTHLNSPEECADSILKGLFGKSEV